jgi:hypothetical protein
MIEAAIAAGYISRKAKTENMILNPRNKNDFKEGNSLFSVKQININPPLVRLNMKMCRRSRSTPNKVCAKPEKKAKKVIPSMHPLSVLLVKNEGLTVYCGVIFFYLPRRLFYRDNFPVHGIDRKHTSPVNTRFFQEP